MNAAVLRYRISALITGVLLLGLCFSMYLKYGPPDNHDYAWLALVHGWFYLIYLGLAFDLSRRRHWPMGWTLIVLLAGTVPLMTFVVERRVARRIADEDMATASASPRRRQ